MKNLGLLTLVGICGALNAQETKSYQLNYNIKSFYKHHNESGYKQHIYGVGVEHNFYQQKGINLGISAFTNVSQLNPYVEKRLMVSYRIPYGPHSSFYPFAETNSFKHKLMYTDIRGTYINKAIFFGGIGYDFKYNDQWQFCFEGSLFKDIENLMLVYSYNQMNGQVYTNPFGGKAVLGLKYFPAEDFYLEMRGFYSSAFDRCYWQSGCEFAIKWGF